jgi:hypothetical protein
MDAIEVIQTFTVIEFEWGQIIEESLYLMMFADYL